VNKPVDKAVLTEVLGIVLAGGTAWN
jgi:hypothetical protein